MLNSVKILVGKYNCYVSCYARIAGQQVYIDKPINKAFEREAADRSAYFASSIPSPPMRVLLIDPETGAVNLIEENQSLAPVQRE